MGGRGWLYSSVVDGDLVRTDPPDFCAGRDGVTLRFDENLEFFVKIRMCGSVTFLCSFLSVKQAVSG